MKRKTYDPTLLRAVGNILAGNQEVQDRLSQGIMAPNIIVEAAVQTVMNARGKLVKVKESD